MRTGKCHICKAIKEDIKWCNLCKHWFCQACRRDYFHRGLEAVKELIGGTQPGCCGPSEQ